MYNINKTIGAEDYAVLERVWFLEKEDATFLDRHTKATVSKQFLLDTLSPDRHTIQLGSMNYPVQWVMRTSRYLSKELYHIDCRVIENSDWKCCLIISADKIQMQKDAE